MERKELIKILENALKAVQEYKGQLHEKTASTKTLNEAAEKKDLEAISGRLIKEAYMIGLSGNVCPTCQGTGRA